METGKNFVGDLDIFENTPNISFQYPLEMLSGLAEEQSLAYFQEMI